MRRDLHVLTAARGGAYTLPARMGPRLRASWICPLDIEGKSFRLHYHDIRGTAVTMLAEAGCRVPEIATTTGHTLVTATRIIEST